MDKIFKDFENKIKSIYPSLNVREIVVGTKIWDVSVHMDLKIGQDPYRIDIDTKKSGKGAVEYAAEMFLRRKAYDDEFIWGSDPVDTFSFVLRGKYDNSEQFQIIKDYHMEEDEDEKRELLENINPIYFEILEYMSEQEHDEMMDKIITEYCELCMNFNRVLNVSNSETLNINAILYRVAEKYKFDYVEFGEHNYIIAGVGNNDFKCLIDFDLVYVNLNKDYELKSIMGVYGTQPGVKEFVEKCKKLRTEYKNIWKTFKELNSMR